MTRLSDTVCFKPRTPGIHFPGFFFLCKKIQHINEEMTEKEKNLSEAELHDICEKYMEELGICDDPEKLQIVYSD